MILHPKKLENLKDYNWQYFTLRMFIMYLKYYKLLSTLIFLNFLYKLMLLLT